MKKSDIPSVLFFLAATSALFLGFYRNQWNIVLPGKFRNFQYDDQSLVMGRLVETRKSGLFSYGGLLGRGDFQMFESANGDADYYAWYTHQYDSYLSGRTFNVYGTYWSQCGGQGIFFGALDLISPFAPAENLRIYRIITSLSFALVIGYILFWFLSEFGWMSALLALATTIASPWLTIFARNLFYFPTFFYIPIAAVTYYLGRHSAHVEQAKLKFGLLVFVTVLLKCLFNGFDFILPSILMIGAPFIYYAVRDRWNIRKFFLVGVVIAAGVAAAIFISLFILTLQSWANSGSLYESVKYIIDTFNRRTMGNPQLYPDDAASLEVSAWEVLRIYLETNWAVVQTGLRFMDLIFIFAGFTFAYFLKQKMRADSPDNARRSRALIAATWASIFSPLLWFVIFKGQSYVHTHTNFLAWYMPFTIYGFALCGHVIQTLFVNPKHPEESA